MEFPKLVIASDGYCTGALLDGVFISQGIGRLDFSTQDENGEAKSSIRILDLDVKRAKLIAGEKAKNEFAEFMESLAGIEKAVSEWSDTAK